MDTLVNGSRYRALCYGFDSGVWSYESVSIDRAFRKDAEHILKVPIEVGRQSFRQGPPRG